VSSINIKFYQEMKSLKLFAVTLMITATTVAFAQDKTETFKVSGVCSMCKKKIENAAKGPGVKSFTWNEETKLAKVTYNTKMVSIADLQKKIAAAGYDTEKFKAADKAFKNLPECCQYDRAEK